MTTILKRNEILGINRSSRNLRKFINSKNLFNKNPDKLNKLRKNIDEQKEEEKSINKKNRKIKKNSCIIKKFNLNESPCINLTNENRNQKFRLSPKKKKVSILSVKNIVSNKDNIISKNSSTGSMRKFKDNSEFEHDKNNFIKPNTLFAKNKNIETKKIRSKRLSQQFIDESNNKNLKKIIKTFPKDERIKFLNDDELNDLKYEYAYEIDIRSYCQFYWSLIKTSNLIISTFLNFTDYNILLLKLGLFIMSFSLFFFINSVFFDDSTMQKLYLDYGKYDIIYQIPRSLYSTLTYKVISLTLRNLALSQKDLVKLKKMTTAKQVEENIVNSIKCLRIKFAIFFSMSFFLLIFFWYFLSAFCAVYRNTQLPLVKNSIISFIISNSYVFLLGLIPGIFRLSSLSGEKNKRCMYQTSQIIRFILV